MRRRRPVAAHSADGPVPLPGPGPGDWAWPWWLQRQLDLSSPAWLPADLAGHNRTGRNWTVIGIPDGDDRWLLDGRGLLAPASHRWSLDWWIGAEDRWRLPSREAGVRQRLLDGAAPVLETAMRVPGGEVVARHWAVPGDGADLVVLEIENASAAPVAVAMALRPVGPAGATWLHRVAVDGRCMSANGITVLCSAVTCRQSAVSDGARGDVAAVVLANSTPEARPNEAACPSGWASAAMVWPLAHRATLHLEIPGAVRDHRRRPAASSSKPGSVEVRPTAEATARGWAARTSRRTRLDLPPGPLGAALEAQRRHLLLAGRPGADLPRVEAARVVAALSSAGLREEAAALLGAWLGDQRRGGLLGRDGVDTAATLWALEVHYRAGDDDGLVARSPVLLARAAEQLAPRAPSSPPEDPVAATWRLAGLVAAARMLAALGQAEAARRADQWAHTRFDALRAALDTDTGAASFGPTTEAALLGVVLGVLSPHDPGARSAREIARRAAAGLPDGAIAGATPLLGLRPSLSLDFATSAALGADNPFDALRWVLAVASPTWTWPTVVAPRLGTGSHGSGHDPMVAAALWTCGRALLVADPLPPRLAAGPAPLDIVPALPPEWIGAGFEVHGLATATGSLSYAVRWHGGRPALLWEVAGTAVPVLTASGLDPAWHGQGRRGEALLGEFPDPRPGARSRDEIPGSPSLP